MDSLSDNDKEKNDGKQAAAERAVPTTPTADIAAPAGPGDELQKNIDEVRKKKAIALDNMRKLRRRQAYKLAEKEALAKLVVMGKKSTKNIGYLRRKKEALEFRISTEAFTLEAEKDLIRKKNEVEEELQEAINSYRLKRKADFVAGDIEDVNKKIEAANLELQEIEKKLDVLYSGLRKARAPPRQKRPEHKPEEVSFADIAIIKDKKEDKKNGGG